MKELILPSLGESVEKGTIVSILVEIGDQISVDQPLMEVETDKVTAEVPAEVSGKVKAILVKVGDEIHEGAPFIQLEIAGTSNVNEVPAAKDGNGVAKGFKEETLSAKDAAPIVIAQKPPILKPTESNATSSPIPKRTIGRRASPLAKKLAREIGVDLSVIPISDSGRISMKDVKAYARQVNSSQIGNGITGINVDLPDFEKWGNVRKQKLPQIARTTSKNMSRAWSQVPHAWLQEKVDITALEAKRQTHKVKLKEQGIALTITSILVKVVAKALEEFPIFNASLDLKNQEIIFKEYIHIGVAADTERGLLVPVLQNANQKSISEIATELGSLSSKAREKKIKVEELEGATFTISNLGGIGTTAIFPVVNFPQLAILGVAASKQEAVWIDGAFEARLMMPLTIGFDHRIINGADAARFLQNVKLLLEDWFLWSL